MPSVIRCHACGHRLEVAGDPPSGNVVCPSCSAPIGPRGRREEEPDGWDENLSWARRPRRPGLVIGAAVALIGLALLGAGFTLWLGTRGGPALLDRARTWSDLVTGEVVYVAGVLVWAALVIAGAVQMLRLRTYWFAVTACFLAMLPIHVCCFLGVPVGIWALTVVTVPDIRGAFR